MASTTTARQIHVLPGQLPDVPEVDSSEEGSGGIGAVLLREGRRGSVEKQQELKQKQLEQQLRAITTAIDAKQAVYVYDERARQNGVAQVGDQSGGRPPSPANPEPYAKGAYTSGVAGVKDSDYQGAVGGAHLVYNDAEVVGLQKRITWSDEHGYSLFEIYYSDRLHYSAQSLDAENLSACCAIQ